MNTWWPTAALLLIVSAVLLAGRAAALQPLFRWLPTPLWCYLLPMMAVTLGWLPRADTGYQAITGYVLPIALTLLLLGVHLPSVIQAGRYALLAAVMGALGITVGAVISVWILRPHLPPEAWKGAGALAGTWTGGSMNLLALRTVLDIPHSMFAPLILVDAIVAYSWMALLVALSGMQPRLNQWLHAVDATPAVSPLDPAPTPLRARWKAGVACLFLAVSLASVARLLSGHLPTSSFVNSSNGWTVLLVTTAALGLSWLRSIQTMGVEGRTLGYAGLYIVLAATGAQGSLEALWAAPVWLVLGVSTALVHGVALLIAGRCWRIPIGLLATASQANIGGVVSAPLVGAVYHASFAPVGLLLAMAGNALGTYVGWLTAVVCRWVVPN